MCKPQVCDIGLTTNGPCGLDARIYYPDACAAFAVGESWRQRIGNVLRSLADRAEGVRSVTVVVHAPPQITFDDSLDALTIGFNGANKYLNDLWRDRVFGSPDTTVGPVLPVGRISR